MESGNRSVLAHTVSVHILGRVKRTAPAGCVLRLKGLPHRIPRFSHFPRLRHRLTLGDIGQGRYHETLSRLKSQLAASQGPMVQASYEATDLDNLATRW